MKKEFLINITLLLTINFLVKPLYLFGVDAHIQNIVGTETYGLYFALFNLVFLCQFIIEPGIQSYNSRNIALHPEKLGYHLPRIIGLKLILFLVFYLAVVSVFFAWGYTSTDLGLVTIIAINLFLSTTYVYLRSNIAAIGKYRADSFLSALDKVLMLIILGVVSWIEPFKSQFTIFWLVYGQLAAYLVACMVVLYVLKKEVRSIRLVISWSYFIQLIRWSYPYIFILLLMSIYNKIDGVMLERMLTDKGAQAGIYAAGYRFVDALNMIGYLFASLLLPMYSSNLQNIGSINDLLHTSLKILSVGVVLIALTLMLYGGHILPFIYADADQYYAQVLAILMLNFVGISLAYLYGTLLVAYERLRVMNVLLLVSVVLNIGLNLLLIPSSGAYGAAIATAITQLFALAGQIILVYRVTPAKFYSKLYLQVISFGLLCTAIFICIDIYWELFWLYKILVSISLSIGAALVFRLVDITSLISMLKKRSPTHE